MDRPSLLRRALALSLVSIVLNGVLGGIAVAVGLATDSVSLLGFGLDAAIDSVASIVLVWRFRTEVREPHRAERIERIAERAVGFVLLGVAVYLAITALMALANGTHPEASTVRTALLLIAVGVGVLIGRVIEGIAMGAVLFAVWTYIARLVAAPDHDPTYSDGHTE